MIYKSFQDIKLSALGLGCMRLPVIEGDFSKIDVDAVREMIAYAMASGINYYDTAWPYHGGTSEKAVGEVLKEYPRDSFYLATKFPGFDKSNMEKVSEIFEKQLENCQVDYFDFYLFHNVNESNIDNYLNPKYGILDYLLEQKKNGRIRHLGFSTHGTIETVNRFLDAYGDHMEFCQIQLNWLDYTLQNAKAKVEFLREKKIPIWVMEPVRGGKLVNIDPAYMAQLKELRPEATPPEWAFRFLQSIPEVVVTLSGMSNMEQLRDNVATFGSDKPLSEAETQALFGIAHDMIAKNTLPCTGCRYCTDHCPQGLDIPRIIEIYNEYVYSGGGFLGPMMIGAMPEEKKPSACLGCRSCEAVCPQNIKISEMMSDFVERLSKK